MKGKSVKQKKSGIISGYGIAVLVLIILLLCAVSPVSANSSDENEIEKNEALTKPLSPERTSRFIFAGLARVLSSRFLESPLVELLDKFTGFKDASLVEEIFGIDQRQEAKNPFPEKNDSFERGMPGKPAALDPPGVSVQNSTGKYSSGSNQRCQYDENGEPNTCCNSATKTCYVRVPGEGDQPDRLVKVHLDENGNISSVIDENGNVAVPIFNSSGNVIGHVDEDGNRVYYTKNDDENTDCGNQLDDYYGGEVAPDRFGIMDNPKKEAQESIYDKFDIWRDRDEDEPGNNIFGTIPSPTVKKPEQGATCDDRLGEEIKGYNKESLNLELEKVKLVDPPQALDSQTIKDNGQPRFHEVLLEDDAW